MPTVFFETKTPLGRALQERFPDGILSEPMQIIPDEYSFAEYCIYPVLLGSISSEDYARLCGILQDGTGASPIIRVGKLEKIIIPAGLVSDVFYHQHEISEFASLWNRTDGGQIAMRFPSGHLVPLDLQEASIDESFVEPFYQLNPRC